MRQILLRHHSPLALAAIALVALGPALPGAQAQPPDAARTAMRAATSPDTALMYGMRRLWADHVTYTRFYIISAAAQLPDKEANAQRLMKNQEDIGNAIKPYYGDEAGAKLTGLLKDHITIATEIVDAAMAGDAGKQSTASTRWTANADEIAAMLSGANPNWPRADLQRMLHSHLELTTNEVKAHLGKDWTGSIAAFDAIRAQARDMADALSSGIAKQFPEKMKMNVKGKVKGQQQ